MSDTSKEISAMSNEKREAADDRVTKLTDFIKKSEPAWPMLTKRFSDFDERLRGIILYDGLKEGLRQLWCDTVKNKLYEQDSTLGEPRDITWLAAVTKYDVDKCGAYILSTIKALPDSPKKNDMAQQIADASNAKT